MREDHDFFCVNNTGGAVLQKDKGSTETTEEDNCEENEHGGMGVMISFS